jgi:hypothetical protein
MVFMFVSMLINIGIIFFVTVLYSCIIICARKIAGLSVSRAFIGFNFSLLAGGYWFSLFSNSLRGVAVFPRPKVLLGFLCFLKKYMGNYESNLLIILGLICLFVASVTLYFYGGSENANYRIRLSERDINVSCGLGIFHFMAMFFLFWDVTY